MSKQLNLDPKMSVSIEFSESEVYFLQEAIADLVEILSGDFDRDAADKIKIKSLETGLSKLTLASRKIFGESLSSEYFEKTVSLLRED